MLVIHFDETFCQINIENVADQFCQCLNNNVTKPDIERLKECLTIFEKNMISVKNDSTRNAIIQDLSIYASTHCKEAAKVGSRLGNKSDFKIIDSIPKSGLTDLQCKHLLVKSKFYYLQKDGSKMFVEINENLWTETEQSNKRLTKCKIKWLNNCEFSLEFLESNDPIKNKISKKGDIYIYNVIEINGNIISLTVSFNSIIQCFKVYLN